MASLKAVVGSEVYGLELGLNAIGRGGDNRVDLFDLDVSRHHAVLTLGPTGSTLRDNGSTKGTFVNGERIEEVALVSGDRILVGATFLEYVHEACGEADGDAEGVSFKYALDLGAFDRLVQQPGAYDEDHLGPGGAAAFCHLSRTVAASDNRHDLLSASLNHLVGHLAANDAFVALADEGSAVLEVVCCFPESTTDRDLPISRHVAKRVLEVGDAVLVEDMGVSGGSVSMEGLMMRSVMYAPLRAQARILGVVGVARGFANPLTHLELNFLALATNLMGMALASLDVQDQALSDRDAMADSLSIKEAELEHAKAFMTTIIGGVPDVMMVINRDYTIALANQAAREMVQGRDPVAAGLKCHEVSHGCASPCVDSGHPCPLQQAVATKAPVTVEHVHQDAQGHAYPVEVTAAPILNENGEVAQVIESCRDITERKRVEKELLQHRENLEELVSERTSELADANTQMRAQMEERLRLEQEARLHQQQLVQADKLASLGTLVAGVAHEINNPNTFIKTNTELFAPAWKDAARILDEHYEEEGDFKLGGLPYSTFKEEAPSLLAAILGGSERIRTIVQELRQFARVDPSGVVEPLDINEVTHSATTLLSNMLKKSTKHFALDLCNEPCMVLGNFQRLEQVMINVILNACQALPDSDKGIYVSTLRETVEEGVRIVIRDEGEGIPEEFLKQIEDPFFSTKHDSGGTGLGLSISSTIIHEHGGTIEFASKDGEGTTVTLRLPALAKEDEG